MKKGKTICIDFDGVIADYQGWQGEDKFGSPIQGVQSAMDTLKNEGYTIIIFTTRKDTEALRKYLKENDIRYDYINENPEQPTGSNPGKPIADMYVDDRSIRFRGNWLDAIREIAWFKSYKEDQKQEKKEMQDVFNRYRELAKESSKCNVMDQIY